MKDKPQQEVIDEKEIDKRKVNKVENQKEVGLLDNFKSLLWILAPILIFILLIPILLLALGVYSYKKYTGEVRPAYSTFKWFYSKRKYLKYFR
jgi:hypothetical protein